MSTPATPQSPPTGTNKADPDTLALRASPRPVTRLNRRMLAVLAGTLGATILGATLWSLQSHKRERNPATELYNVDRVSHAENLDQLPKDYSKVPVVAKPVPALGEPLPGDLGPANRACAAQRRRIPPSCADWAHCAAKRRRGGSTLSGFLSEQQCGEANTVAHCKYGYARASVGQPAVQSDGLCRRVGAADRPDGGTEPAGSETGLRREWRRHCHPQSRQPAIADLALPSDGGHHHSGSAGNGHQLRLAGAGHRQRHRGGL